jgi:uncharacterized protein YndB with AHSA1/START domain
MQMTAVQVTGRHRHVFAFRSVWHVDAGPARVYAALERAEEYPSWWPQVREVRTSGGQTGWMRVRSVLPYDLCMTGRAVRHDPQAGVLELELGGDLEGRLRWTVAEAADSRGSVVLFEQRVEVRKPLMRRLAVPARPVFRANHAVMMRAGRRGLQRWLASGLDDG